MDALSRAGYRAREPSGSRACFQRLPAASQVRAAAMLSPRLMPYSAWRDPRASLACRRTCRCPRAAAGTSGWAVSLVFHGALLAAGRVSGRPALAADPGARRPEPVPVSGRRWRWRRQPRGIYYPAFEPAARATASDAGHATGDSSRSGSTAGGGGRGSASPAPRSRWTALPRWRRRTPAPAAGSRTGPGPGGQEAEPAAERDRAPVPARGRGAGPARAAGEA